MLIQSSKFAGLAILLGAALVLVEAGAGQGPNLPGQIQLPDAGPGQPIPLDPPQVPKGVEVQARGPVHEAFAAPTVEPKPTPLVAKKPPAPVEELPPEDRPEGNVVWISGYWSFDDDRGDYLWVSGCWRTRPPGKEWIAGYWREQDDQHQWVPGFWTTAAAPQARGSEVTYYAQPPEPPNVAPPGEPPVADSFFVPGHWHWQGERYLWRPGYWARVQPGYVWVSSHYRWSPHGYVFVPGYWDMAVTRRGVLYAPVTVDFVVAGPRFVFTPTFAVCDAIVLDALFVRPAHCHYYFGDYYGPRYHRLGFESCVVYSRRCYDPVIVYERWDRRHDPRWFDVQINLTFARDAGRAPLPPRTLVQQNTIVQNRTTNVTNINNVTNVTNVYNNTVIAPTKVVTAARGQKTVALDTTARAQAQTAAKDVQATAIKERKAVETNLGGPPTKQPRTASFSAPTKVNGGNPTGVGPPIVNKPMQPKGQGTGNPVVTNPNTFNSNKGNPGTGLPTTGLPTTGLPTTGLPKKDNPGSNIPGKGPFTGNPITAKDGAGVAKKDNPMVPPVTGVGITNPMKTGDGLTGPGPGLTKDPKTNLPPNGNGNPSGRPIMGPGTGKGFPANPRNSGRQKDEKKKS